MPTSKAEAAWEHEIARARPGASDRITYPEAAANALHAWLPLHQAEVQARRSRVRPS